MMNEPDSNCPSTASTTTMSAGVSVANEKRACYRSDVYDLLLSNITHHHSQDMMLHNIANIMNNRAN